MPRRPSVTPTTTRVATVRLLDGHKSEPALVAFPEFHAARARCIAAKECELDHAHFLWREIKKVRDGADSPAVRFQCMPF